jgi:RNA polymerase primary sigma factor
MAEVLNIYMKELSNAGSNKEESLELLRKAKNGDMQSRDILTKNYLLLVVKIARKYRDMGVLLEDIVAEGNIGLMTAIEKYDFEKGAPFSTCAKFWIKQAIVRNCMHKKRLVRLPEHVSELMRTNRWHGESYREVSIDTPNDEGDTMADMIVDHDQASPFQDENTLIAKRKLDTALGLLKSRDAEIVKACYGIGLEEPMEIVTAAKLFNLSTTRINQILRNSIKRMGSSEDEQVLVEDEGLPVEIISAMYGTENSKLDVTDKVVDLHLKGSPIKANNRLGGDPSPGNPKKLFISYIFGDVIFEKEFTEGSIAKF